MAYFFGDGFDLYAAITDCGTYWDASFGGNVISLSSTGRFAGSHGLLSTGSGSVVPYITKTSGVNDAVHHISLAFQQGAALSGTSVAFFVTFYDGATAQCSIGFQNGGNIVLAAGTATGTVLATYTGAVTASNTWYQFEFEVVINNTAGSFAVRKLGNTSNDFFLGSLNTRASANNYANKIGVGSNVNPTQIIDDFLWRSDASSLAWLGDIRCYTRMPLTDAAVAFTPSASIVPVTPYTGSLASNSSANTARYTPFVATCDGGVGSATVSLNAGYTGNMKCSLFANSGSNLPGSVLGSATPIANPVTGINTFTFGTPVAVTHGVTYWIGLDTDTGVAGSWTVPITTVTTGLYTCPSVTSSTTYATFPAANPTITATAQPANIFTVNITPTTAYNANMIAEAVNNYGATYVYSSTVGQSDLYNLASISATPGSIVGVTTRSYMQKSDAGTRIAAVQLQSGASNVQGSLTLNTTWGWAFRNDLVDPATGAAWTATGVNNAQIGVVLTT